VKTPVDPIVKNRPKRADQFVPNAKTIKAMKEARAGKTKAFDSVEALMTDLCADD
jgi:DNA-damage-inducible protein J